MFIKLKKLKEIENLKIQKKKTTKLWQLINVIKDFHKRCNDHDTTTYPDLRIKKLQILLFNYSEFMIKMRKYDVSNVYQPELS